jgi:hypothetical protein
MTIAIPKINVLPNLMFIIIFLITRPVNSGILYHHFQIDAHNMNVYI